MPGNITHTTVIGMAPKSKGALFTYPGAVRVSETNDLRNNMTN